MKRVLSWAFYTLLYLVGFGLLLFPTLSNWVYEQRQAGLVAEYEQAVDTTGEAELARQSQLAEDYNAQLQGEGIEDPFVLGSGVALPDNYTSVLNVDGIMGYIDIPKIDVRLCLYHGTSEEVLQKGIGHMEATSLPIGGEGTHSVLTGHRGLPSARLFTDLDQLEEGDVFYLTVLGEVLCYEIDRILVVEPTETSYLKPVEGEDYVTLITCTPYAVNSHRLLVRGKRISYVPPEEAKTPIQVATAAGRHWNLVAAAVLLAWLAVALWLGRRRSRGRR